MIHNHEVRGSIPRLATRTKRELRLPFFLLHPAACTTYVETIPFSAYLSGMKRLYRYMIASFTGPFVMTFFIAMIVLILNFVWKWVDELVGKGLSWGIVTELLFYVSIRLIPMALILGVLLASIMAFGKLGEHSELSALKASGISLTRIMYPVIWLVVFMMIGAFFFSNYVVPRTNLKFYTLLLDIRHQRPELDIREGQFYNGIEGYSLMIGDRSRDGRMLYDLMVYDHTARSGNTAVTIADSGQMVITQDSKHLLLTLYNGSSYAELLGENNRVQKNRPFRRDRFEMQQFLFNLPGSEFERTDQELYKDNYLMKNMKQLTEDIRGLTAEREDKLRQVGANIQMTQLFRFEDKKEVKDSLTSEQDSLAMIRTNIDSIFSGYPLFKKTQVIEYAVNLARTTQNTINSHAEEYRIRSRWINWHKVEWQRKMTQSFACLIFLLIGAPLGAIIRKGGLGTPVVVSVIFYIFYHIISLAGEKYAKAGVLPVWIGMWGSSILLLPVGIYLTIKSTRDSIVLNTETYLLLIRNLLAPRKRRKSPAP